MSALAQANTAGISEMRALQQVPREHLLPDQAVDMFTERGFGLAQRIAKAFATSDAVPAQFRMLVEKKSPQGSNWVENTSALGNCLVAIEVARAVRMSITAVMQNADMIEGKLRWSGKFVIAAINASGRFTPLRFQMRNLGRIKASYKEKTGWDNQARRPIFTERTVEVENVECIAWALPKGVAFPPGVHTLDHARAAGLPVIESAPVSMKMAVEEGWYGKPGSKWQTELRTLMFQYRAGSFFGNIHAPDIVMGMGPTTEDVRDMTTIDVAPDGSIRSVTTEEITRRMGDEPQLATQVVQQVNTTGTTEHEEVAEAQQPQEAPAQSAAGPQQSDQGWQPSQEELQQIREREMSEATNAPTPAPAPPARRSRVQQPIE